MGLLCGGVYMAGFYVISRSKVQGLGSGVSLGVSGCKLLGYRAQGIWPVRSRV